MLFNYQSYEENPAVLAIIATREGTSVTVIDNKRDGFQGGYSWGQRLFFNQNGNRASLTGERLNDFTDKEENKIYAGRTLEENQDLNMILLIQVPLKQKIITRKYEADYQKSVCESSQAIALRDNKSDIENAVIGHGKVEGPFTEIADLEIARDPAFPIRVTVQFYKATSNGIVSEKNIREISEQINKVYSNADYVGSLVLGGPTGRPAEYIGDKIPPPDWWEQFWKRHQTNLGQTKEDAWNFPCPRWGIIEPEGK